MSESTIINEDIATIVRGIATEASDLSGRTLLISGGAGFLGKYFVGSVAYLNKHVLEKPCRVISVDNYITGASDPAFPKDEFVQDVWADVANPLPVREDVDYIIHAAGLASPVYYMKYPMETIESAVEGAKNLLELAKRNEKLKGFMFFSSSEIYGDPDPKAVPTPESYFGHVSSVGPRACYDESKRLAETICTIYHQLHRVPVKTVRPFNIFGPGMKHDDRRVVPMFTYQALNNEVITVHGDGHQTRTFCYITDAMIGFWKVLLRGKDGEAYNVGNEQNEISMRDLAAEFVTATGSRTGFEMVPYPATYPAGEPQRRCPDVAKARENLGFESTVNFREGVQRFINWARQQPSYVEAKVNRERVAL